MHVLPALQLTLAFFSTLSLCLVHRDVFLLLVEFFLGIGGFILCLFPRLFHERHLDSFHLAKDGPGEAPNLHILHGLGGFQLGLVLLSFLSRSRTSDETVKRNVMFLWAQRFALDVITHVKFVSAMGTILKKIDGQETEVFDLSKVSENELSILLVMAGLLLSCVIHLFRWPVYRVQTSMATDDRANMHLFLYEVFLFLSGLVHLIYPESMHHIPGFDFEFDANTTLMIRHVGVIILIVGGYVHQAQNYYSPQDKAPIFKAALFVALTNSVHMGVYLSLLPVCFPIQYYTGFLLITGLIAANLVLGLRATDQDACKKID